MFRDVRSCAVGVSDTDAAIAFFTGRLGFEVRVDVPLSETTRWVEVAPEGASTSIALQSGEGASVGVDTGIRLVVEDARSEHSRLSASGVTVGQLIVSDFAPPMFTFSDPDANVYYAVELTD